MNRFHSFKRWPALFLSLLLLLGCCSACKSAQEAAAPVEPPIVVKNSGKESALTVGMFAGSAARRDALREIADKYTADFPNTKIEIREYESADALFSAIQAGEAQIIEAESGRQGLLGQGELLNLRPYLEGWEEYTTLDGPAKAALNHGGSERPCYLMPSDFYQPLLIYRADWVQEYNTGKEWRDTINTETWESLVNACEKLGERGQVLFSAQDLPVLFHTVLWSDIGMNALADPGAGYFAAPPVVDGEPQEVTGKTIFTASGAPAALETFQKFLSVSRSLEGREAAEAAFISGEGAALVADRTTLPKLSAAMPEGAFAVQGLPHGRSETTVTSLDSYTGWSISAQVEDWESAVHFLFFLSNADNNTHYAKVCKTLPIHVTAEDLEGSLASGDLAAEMDLISKGGEYQYAWAPTGYAKSEGWDEALSVKLNDFIDGSGQDELLHWLDDTWTSAFQEQGKAF